MPTTDYNQQLLWYLQNWRRLLEQWAAMAAGSPFPTAPPMLPTAPAGGQFMPPFMPFMPFMPPMPPMPMGPIGPPTAAGTPVPPAPADYTQQLFSYLQAWRQYLEQATGASPAWPQAWTPPPPTAVPATDGGKTGPNRPPNGPIPPENPSWNTGFPQSDDTKKSDPIPPKLINRPPFRSDQTQLTEINFDPIATPFDRPGERFHMADPAVLTARPITSHPMSEATAHPEMGSAFLRTMHSVGPAASAQVEPGFREHGETPSP
nr:hypothetical protein [Mycobacterium sp. 852002-40037_SCH5390672]